MINWIGIPDNIEEYYGFIYMITNLITGQYYIGKKFFWSQTIRKTVKKPTKIERERLATYKEKKSTKYITYKNELINKYCGKINRERLLKESDWKTYWGSCNYLHDEIDKYGKDNFKREIIRLCKDKWECSYYEMVEQVNNNVLFDEKSYNGIIDIKIGRRNRRGSTS